MGDDFGRQHIEYRATCICNHVQREFTPLHCSPIVDHAHLHPGTCEGCRKPVVRARSNRRERDAAGVCGDGIATRIEVNRHGQRRGNDVIRSKRSRQKFFVSDAVLRSNEDAIEWVDDRFLQGLDRAAALKRLRRNDRNVGRKRCYVGQGPRCVSNLFRRYTLSQRDAGAAEAATPALRRWQFVDRFKVRARNRRNHHLRDPVAAFDCNEFAA